MRDNQERIPHIKYDSTHMLQFFFWNTARVNLTHAPSHAHTLTHTHTHTHTQKYTRVLGANIYNPRVD